MASGAGPTTERRRRRRAVRARRRAQKTATHLRDSLAGAVKKGERPRAGQCVPRSFLSKRPSAPHVSRAAAFCVLLRADAKRPPAPSASLLDPEMMPVSLGTDTSGTIPTSYPEAVSNRDTCTDNQLALVR